MSRKQRCLKIEGRNIVGTIHTPGGFAAASGLRLDAVEVRFDSIDPAPGRLAALRQPIIATVRRFDEGGSRSLPASQRAAVYLANLRWAAALDIELRSVRPLASVLEAARSEAKMVILSFHNFAETPSSSRLRRVCEDAKRAGADIVKIATQASTAGEISRLLALLDQPVMPTAVMAMGPLGRASRLLFAQAGSVLNYGWLGRPQVAGQWGAREFLKLLERAVLSDSPRPCKIGRATVQ